MALARKPAGERDARERKIDLRQQALRPTYAPFEDVGVRRHTHRRPESAGEAINRHFDQGRKIGQ